MYVIYRKSSPNKLRDINIAIAYHNTGRTLKSVGNEYKVAPERVRQIHSGLVRHICRCTNIENPWHYTEHKNHSEQVSIYLQEYKYLLEENELRTEITLNDADDNKSVLVLSTCIRDGYISVSVHECDEDGKDLAIEVLTEDLKHALRKLSTK